VQTEAVVSLIQLNNCQSEDCHKMKLPPLAE